jgi:uncharacterized protein (TIGR02680 family)
MRTNSYSGIPEGLQRLVQHLNTAPGRWRPSRLILRNYWLVGRQDFSFVQGRLNLRGNNGLGKSTLLIPCITLALDGDRRRSRMDSFGSTVKAIEDYLIGPPGVSRGHPLFHNERTGYIALEFQKGGSEQYVTVGLGMHASRASDDRSADVWYFVLTDGRRIGFDFELDADGQPFDMKTLEARIGEGGKVTKKLYQYQQWVNDLLFRFESVQDFKNLTEILVRLRTPKLSNDLAPSTTAKYLSEALPSLSVETLEKVATNLQELNAFRAQVKEKERHATAVDGIHRAQASLVRLRAQEAAIVYLEAHEGFEKADRQLSKTEEDLRRSRKDMAEAAAELQRVELELGGLKGRLAAADSDDLVQDERELERVREDIAALGPEHRRHDDRVREEEGQRNKLRRELEDTHLAWPDGLERAHQHIRGLRKSLEPFRWDVPAVDLEALTTGLKSASISDPDSLTGLLHGALVGDALNRRRDLLTAVLGALRKLNEARQKHDVAKQKVQEAKEHYDSAVHERQAADKDLEDARQGFRAEVQAWRTNCLVLHVSDETAGEVQSAVDAFDSPETETSSLLQPVERIRSEIQKLLNEERAAARQQAEVERTRAREISAQIDALRKSDPVPVPRLGQERARELLGAAGIPFVPLYAAANLATLEPDSAEAVYLEAALEEAGLLDALIVDPARVAEVEALLDPEAADRWIRPAPVDDPSLLDLLVLEETVLPEEVLRRALGSIALGATESSACAVDVDGFWSAGALRGHATVADRERVRYLGATNRQLERERKIRELEEQASVAVARAGQADLRAMDADARLRTLDEEFVLLKALPALKNLRRGAQRLAAARRRVTETANEMETQERNRHIAEGNQRAAEQEHLQKVRAAPEAEGRDEDELELLRQTLSDARVEVGHLTRAIADLAGLQNRAERLESDLQMQIERLDSAQQTFRTTELRRASLKGRENELSLKLEAQELDLAVLRQRRQELRLAIETSEESLVDWRVLEGTAKKDEERFAGELSDRTREHSAALQLEREEAGRLGTRLRVYESVAAELQTYEGPGGPIEAARALLARRSGPLRQMKANVASDVEDARTTLEKARNTEDARALPFPLEVRPDLCIFRVKSAELAPNRLLARIREEIEELAVIITEKDEELFSNFLLHTVGDEIRNLIFRAREEVKSTNAILGTHPLSHGRRLRLKWDSIRKPDHKSASAHALAALMQKAFEAHLPLDQEKFRTLLRRRLEDVEREVQEKRAQKKGKITKDETFQTRLEQALDYRSWFEFRIYLDTPDGSEVELDDDEFKRHSGGEKSLNMFIPLLAAVKVRYMGARNADAPLMIGLDEAFAGVDTEKTNGMFSLLRNFEFSWVMTSEKLWGMAPGLPGCATYNLFLEQDTLVPVLFVWDGQTLRNTLETSSLRISLAGAAGGNGTAEIASV